MNLMETHRLKLNTHLITLNNISLSPLSLLLYSSLSLSPLSLSLSLSPQVEFEGLTGRVEFNSKGQRTNYTLKILEKHPEGHKEVRGQRGSLSVGPHGPGVHLTPA